MILLQQILLANDWYLIQWKKRGTTSLSTLQRNHADTIDQLLIKRKQIRDQELQLASKLTQLVNQGDQIQQEERKKGYRNRDADVLLSKSVAEIQDKLSQIDLQRGVILDQFQQSKSNGKAIRLSALNIIGNNHDDLYLYRDKINQDSQKLKNLRDRFSSHIDDVIPHEPHTEEATNFINQAHFYYDGLKFQSDDEQKLLVLSNLRKQMERHVAHRGLYGAIIEMPFKQDGTTTLLTQQQKSVQHSEYNTTVYDIMELRRQYVESGGSDPKMLLELNNLESYYKHAHPIKNSASQSEEIESFADTHKKAMFTMNLQERGSLTGHPVFQYLPSTFRKEVLQLESENNLAKQANSINPIINESLYNATKTESSVKAEESKLEYLRQAEFDIVSSLTLGDYDRDAKLIKLKELSKLKADAEKSLLESRVQQALAEREETMDTLNKKPTKKQRETYLNYLRGALQHMPIEYEPEEGFVIRVDFLNHLPILYSDIKVDIGTQGTFDVQVETQRHGVVQESLHECKAILFERFQFSDQIPNPDIFVFFRVRAFSEELAGNWMPIELGWTLLPIFNKEGQLLTGRFSIPLYPSDINPTVHYHQFPEVNSIRLGFRVALPKEPHFDSENQVLIENDYRLPTEHQKTQNLVTIARAKPPPPKKGFFPLELQGINANDPRLRNSQLPPNSFTLNFTMIDEEEMARRQQIAEYEQQKANRPRLRLQAKGGDKPAAGAGERPKLGAMKKKPVEAPGQVKQNTPKQGDYLNPTQQDVQEENLLMFYLLRLDELDAKLFKTIKLKLAIFVKNKVADDIQKKPLLHSFDVQPSFSDENSLRFTLSHTFNFIIQDMLNLYSEQELLETYLFLGFFDEKSKLFGWNAITIFKLVNDGFKLNSGHFMDNVLKPPGQQRTLQIQLLAPFDRSKMIRSDIRITFLIKQDDQPESKLPEFDNYVAQPRSKTTDKPLKKIPIVENPKWTSQLKLDMTKLLKFDSKNNCIKSMKFLVICRVALLQDSEMVIDVIKRPCMRQDPLDVFEGSSKTELNVNHTVIFRLGYQYLLDMFHADIKSVVYFFTFFQGDKLIGIVQFPLYDAKLKLLNMGKHVVPLFQLDNQGIQGKKIQQQIEFTLKEEPLRLDDIEATPKYLKPVEQVKEETVQISKEDKNKRLIVFLEGMTEYLRLESVGVTVQIINGAKQASDFDNKKCIFEGQQEYPPIEAERYVKLQEQYPFNFPINKMITGSPEDLRSYMLLLEFHLSVSKEPIGWFACPIFINNKLNEDKYNIVLLAGKCPGLPIDFTGAKKTKVKVQFRLMFEEPLSRIGELNPEQAILQLQSGSTSLAQSRRKIVVQDDDKQTIFKVILFNAQGIEGSQMCYLKVALMVEEKFLKDDQGASCAYTTDRVQNQNKLLNLDQRTFKVAINPATMLSRQKDDTIMLVYILGPNEEPIAWYYRPFFKADKVHKGKWVENCYEKPFQRPPFTAPPKKCAITIQFEVR